MLGSEESSADESFTMGLLEYPQYTRPAEYEGMRVPDVLLGGNHRDICAWRREEALKITGVRIPTLEEAMEFIDDDELVEITPKSIRMRKKILGTEARKKLASKQK